MPFRASLNISGESFDSGDNLLEDLSLAENWVTIKLMERDYLDGDSLVKKAKRVQKDRVCTMCITEGISAQFTEIPICPICFDSLEDNRRKAWSRMECCSGPIHADCYSSMLDSSHGFCLYCHSVLPNYDKIPPFGIMTVQRSDKKIWFQKKKTGLIYIEYHMRSGEEFSGCSRGAYVPDTAEGNRIVDRIIHAFKLGLVFRVGRSLTRGVDNVVVWGGVHHKTDLTGTFGFPDETYLERIGDELRSLNITGPFKGDIKKGNRTVTDSR